MAEKNSLWKNIRANRGSVKKPTTEMLRQERKIKAKYDKGGPVGEDESDIPYRPLSMPMEGYNWADQSNLVAVNEQGLPYKNIREFEVSAPAINKSNKVTPKQQVKPDLRVGNSLYVPYNTSNYSEPRYVAERDASSTKVTPAMSTKPDKDFTPGGLDLQDLDVITDVMQLGNFVPHPVGWGIGQLGNWGGAVIDGIQAYDAYEQGNYGDMTANIISAGLGAYLGGKGKGYTRDMNNTVPGSMADRIASFGSRSGTYRPLTATPNLRNNAVINRALNFNRAGLGVIGAETIYDSKAEGGPVKSLVQPPTLLDDQIIYPNNSPYNLGINKDILDSEHNDYMQWERKFKRDQQMTPEEYYQTYPSKQEYEKQNFNPSNIGNPIMSAEGGYYPTQGPGNGLFKGYDTGGFLSDDDKRKKRNVPARDNNTDALTREVKKGVGIVGQGLEDVGRMIDSGASNFVPTGQMAREFYFNNYAPVEYPNVLDMAYPILGAVGSLVNPYNLRSRSRLKSTISDLYRPNRPIGLDKEKNYNIGEEAWRKALNLPTKEKYIIKSEYKPTNAKDANAQYYTINPNVIDKQKIIDYVNSDNFNTKSNPGIGLNSKVTNMETFSDFIKDDFMDKEEYYQIDPIQQFQMSKSWDPEKKQWYASIYDKYDFDSESANKVVKPYEFYDRVYYNSDEKPFENATLPTYNYANKEGVIGGPTKIKGGTRVPVGADGLPLVNLKEVNITDFDPNGKPNPYSPFTFANGGYVNQYATGSNVETEGEDDKDGKKGWTFYHKASYNPDTGETTKYIGTENNEYYIKPNTGNLIQRTFPELEIVGYADKDPVEPTIDPYTYPKNTNAAKAWEVQQKVFPKAVKSSNDWYESWYRGRKTLPEFKNVASDRYNAVKTNQVSINLETSPDYKSKGRDGLLATTYRKEVIDPKNKPYENKIYINNAVYPDGEFNADYNLIFENPQYSKQYLKNEAVHETSHWLENNFPQLNTDRDDISSDNILNKIIPKEYLVPNNKSTKYNEPTYYDFNFNGLPENEGFKYVARPTELRARLERWREMNNISPTKKYTDKEIQTIINKNIEHIKNNPNSEYDNVIELYKFIHKNPKVLQQMNEKFVSNEQQNPLDNLSPQNDIQKAATGGYINPYNQYAPGGYVEDELYKPIVGTNKKVTDRGVEYPLGSQEFNGGLPYVQIGPGAEVVDQLPDYLKEYNDEYDRRMGAQRQLQNAWYPNQEYDQSNMQERADKAALDAAALFILERRKKQGKDKSNYTNRQSYLRSFNDKEKSIIEKSNLAGDFAPDAGSSFGMAVSKIIQDPLNLYGFKPRKRSSKNLFNDSDVSQKDYENSSRLGLFSPFNVPLEIVKSASKGNFGDVRNAFSGEMTLPWTTANKVRMGQEGMVPFVNMGLDMIADPSNIGGLGLAENIFGKIGKASSKANQVADLYKAQNIPVNNIVTPSVNNVAFPPVKWNVQSLPGLHLKSTMMDGPILKIVEPKTGLVNVEQALAMIAKEAGGPDKVAIIKKGLGEVIPAKMDFNKFRKVVQDQLIPLERQFSLNKSNYGVSRLGYPYSSRDVYEKRIAHYEKMIDVYKQRIASGDKSLGLNQDLQFAITTVKNDKKDLALLPLENNTLILSNANKFGWGSGAHGNPKETLGHIHFLIDSETPNTITGTQIQSDPFQGTHRSMPKNKADAAFGVKSLKDKLDAKKEIYSKAVPRPDLGIDFNGEVSWYELPDKTVISKDQFERGAKIHEEIYNLRKAELDNFEQKVLLDKNHQERFLQEFVQYAAGRDDINKVRLPTYETAAKIQNFEVTRVGPDTIKVILDNDTFDDYLITVEELAGQKPTEQDAKMLKKLYNEVKENNGVGNFSFFDPEYDTILKKYNDYGTSVDSKGKKKQGSIEKLFGVEPTIVTDSKGNTWYEFDIPESFKGGKGEIKAFSTVGAVIGAGAAGAAGEEATKPYNKSQ